MFRYNNGCTKRLIVTLYVHCMYCLRSVHRLILDEARRFGSQFCFRFQGTKKHILVELADRAISMAHQSRRFPCLKTEAELTYRNVALHKSYTVNKIPPPHPKKQNYVCASHAVVGEQ